MQLGHFLDSTSSASIATLDFQSLASLLSRLICARTLLLLGRSDYLALRGLALAGLLDVLIAARRYET